MSNQEPMNREMRRMSSKMGYDAENQRANAKQQAGKKNRKPAPHEKQPNIFVRIITFFKEAGKELKKVSWPSRREVINSTIVVLVCVVLVTALILAVDWGAERLAELVYG